MNYTEIKISTIRPQYYNNYTTKPKRKVPVIITAFFFMLTFIFGMNFGFTKVLNKKINVIAKVIYTTISLVIIFILSVPLRKPEHEDFCWYVVVFLQFSFYFLVYNTSKYTLFDFLHDLHNIDQNISQINKLKVSVFPWMYFILWYSIKIFFIFINCEIYFPDTCDFIYFPYYVYSIPSLGINFMFVVPTVIYCHLYYCIKDIHKLLKTDLNVSLLKMRYIAIADSYEKIAALYDKLIMLMLLDIPKMMGLIYNMLKYLKESTGIFTSIGEYMYALNIISNIVCSGAMVQMLKYQVDALKIQLNNMLLYEKDDNKSEEINRILGYIEARRLWRPVAGVIPVDMRLATSAFSVFATYMIVLVQLTHIID